MSAASLGLGLEMVCSPPFVMGRQIPEKQGAKASDTSPTPLLVRQNIASLTDQQIASFRKGVEVMKSRPVNDPTSWSFQANIHGTLGPVTSPLFNQCQHGTIQFLSWHRGYVYFFERILRKASGDPSLTLPYWDWTTAPALPAAFRSPADASNPLYDDTRNLNNGAQLPPSVVVDDLNTALAFVDFETPASTGFSPSLEGSPHGSVHVLIGGNMSTILTAANDPIFWMHHCNIDRLLNRWLDQGAGRITPTDSSFLDQPYSYADENGQTVTMKASDILSSAGLGYGYDLTPNPAAAPAARVAGALALAAPIHGGPMDKLTLVASSAPLIQANAVPDMGAKPLSYKPETVKLAITPQGSGPLKSAFAAARPAGYGVAILEISGLSFAAAPNFTYEIFLNPPRDASQDRLRLHKVGTVNFFVGRHAPGDHAAEKAQTFDQRFDVTGLVARLREAGDLDPQDLNVVLIPVSTIPPAGKEDAHKLASQASAEKAKITYQKINLLVNP